MRASNMTVRIAGSARWWRSCSWTERRPQAGVVLGQNPRSGVRLERLGGGEFNLAAATGKPLNRLRERLQLPRSLRPAGLEAHFLVLLLRFLVPVTSNGSIPRLAV